MVCLWNALFSADRLSSFRSSVPLTTPYTNTSEREFLPSKTVVQDEITKSMINNWMESTYINIPLLGLKVSISDFSFYNSSVMLFLTLYLLLSERRENREIGRLFQDVHNKRFRIAPECYLPTTVYRSVMSYMVFNLAMRPDEPIVSIVKDEEKPTKGPPHGSAMKVFMTNKYRSYFPEYNISLLRQIVSAVFFLPFASIVINSIYHIYFIIVSGFPWEEVLLSRLWMPVMAWEFICMFYVFYLTWKIKKFHNCTKTLVDEFKTYSVSEAGQFGEEVCVQDLGSA